MAINIIEYNVMRRMRQELMLPLGGDILELGEANWYGDVDLNLLLQDITNFAPPAQQASRREKNKRKKDRKRARNQGGAAPVPAGDEAAPPDGAGERGDFRKTVGDALLRVRDWWKAVLRAAEKK